MLLIFIASCGIGYVIYEDTLTAWWIPVGMALLIALATIPFYKKWIWLTTMDDKVINCLCHLACIGAISYVLFLGGNYWFADPASTHEETVMVQKKYVETHKKRSILINRVFIIFLSFIRKYKNKLLKTLNIKKNT